LENIESEFFGFLESYKQKCLKEESYSFTRQVSRIVEKGLDLDIILSRIDNDYLDPEILKPKLHLDVLSFFFIFRVLLDDITKITRYFYPKHKFKGARRKVKRRRKFLTSFGHFKDPLMKEALEDLDIELMSFLNERVPTLWNSIRIRNALVHKLGQIIALPQGKEIIVLKNLKCDEWRFDFDQEIHKIIKEFRGLQEFYIDHFSEKVREYCPNFNIYPPVGMPPKLGRFFI